MRTLALAVGLSLAMLACSDRPEMKVEPNPVEAGTTVWARFDRPIDGRATNQYWIVIAPRGAGADYQEGRLHIQRSAEGQQLRAPAHPGDYEIRLHGDWPKREHHLVRAVPLVVVPNPNIVGAL
jgi:hypothetical protein